MATIDRRQFIQNTSKAGLGSALLMHAPFLSHFSKNEQVNIALIGLGGRSHGIAQAVALCDHIQATHICDVDEKQIAKFVANTKASFSKEPTVETDFRKLLENPDIDAIAITTPEHWHAPMAIMAMQAGKHVYVEKPCSHNLLENEMLVKAQKIYGKVCQMGNQQRSSVTSNQAIKDIREDRIGEVYFGKAWYANTRGPIGRGKQIPVPKTLDWDLWQGPAPREEYRDNVHPYNWHWFRTWGTGEIHNNGTHEIDICRWALNVQLPKRVVSTGGRLHYKNDDWEFYDTQVANYEFEGGKTIIWEGKSCNGEKPYNRGRGAIVYGTEGTILLDRSGYQLMDLNGKKMESHSEKNTGTSSSTKDLTGFDGLTIRHMQNFVNAIREGEKLKAPIDDASISTHLCHLGNIAQELEVSLKIDPATGKILDNKMAMSKWGRTYEKGWEVKV